MGEGLSIIKVNEELDADTRRADLGAAFFKTLVSAAPRVGPYLTEVLGVAIPDLKFDRVVTFARVPGDRVKYLEEDVVRPKSRTQEFADLPEDGVTQASAVEVLLEAAGVKAEAELVFLRQLDLEDRR